MAKIKATSSLSKNLINKETTYTIGVLKSPLEEQAAIPNFKIGKSRTYKGDKIQALGIKKISDIFTNELMMQPFNEGELVCIYENMQSKDGMIGEMRLIAKESKTNIRKPHLEGLADAANILEQNNDIRPKNTTEAELVRALNKQLESQQLIIESLNNDIRLRDDKISELNLRINNLEVEVHKKTIENDTLTGLMEKYGKGDSGLADGESRQAILDLVSKAIEFGLPFVQSWLQSKQKPGNSLPQEPIQNQVSNNVPSLNLL